MAAVPSDDKETNIPSQPEARGDVWSDLRAVKQIESTQREINDLKTAVAGLQRRWVFSTVIFGILVVLLGAGLVYAYVQLSGIRQQRQSARWPHLSLLPPIVSLDAQR